MPKGRPTNYTDEIASEICERMAEGESLLRICKDDHIPPRRTVVGWLMDGNQPDFSSNYADAQRKREEVLFEEIVEIPDEFEGIEDVSAAVVAAAKLRTDARKWVLARMNRSKFGERSAVDLGGQDGAEVKFSWKPPQVSGDDDAGT